MRPRFFLLPLLWSALLVPVAGRADVLDRAVSHLEIHQADTKTAFEEIGRTAGVRILVPEAEAAEDRCIGARFDGCTVRAALHVLFGPSLQACTIGEAISVDLDRNMPTETRSYSIADLIVAVAPQSRGDGAQMVVDLIEGYVRSDDWADNGGRFEIRTAGNSLEVRQTPEGHAAVRNFLELLRGAYCRNAPPMLDPDLRWEAAVMHRTLPDMRLKSVPLEEAVDQICTAAGCNFFVDWNSLEGAGISRSEPVTLDLSRTDVCTALDSLCLAMHGQLSFAFEGGIVVLGPHDAADRFSVVRTYDVRPWIEMGLSYPTARVSVFAPAAGLQARREAARDSLTRLIEDLVATDTWRDNGGASGIFRELGGRLIVAQSRRAHLQIVALLDQIQAAARPGGDAAALPDPQPGLLHTDVGELDFSETPLRQVFQTLADRARTQIMIDWKSLEAAGIAADAPVTLRLSHPNLQTALTVVLDLVPAGKAKLGFNVDGNGMIHIAALDDLPRTIVTRVYNIRDLIDSYIAYARAHGQTRANSQDAVDAITKWIEDTVDTDSWKDNGGSVGALREFAGLLIVSTSTETHRKLKSELEKLRQFFQP